MRNVKRVDIPVSLKRNKGRWLKALLKKMEECSRTREKVPDSFFDKYKKDDVKDALKSMYKELCCYCESSIGVVEFGHIEHRKPKRKYPKYTFDWENLHLSCTACNEKKWNQYDETNPILDAAAKEKITKHLTYKCDDGEVWVNYKTPRGWTTIRHADLNREKLKINRSKVLLKVFQMIKDIKKKPNAAGVEITKQRLRAMCKGEYGSVVSFGIEGMI